MIFNSSDNKYRRFGAQLSLMLVIFNESGGRRPLLLPTVVRWYPHGTLFGSLFCMFLSVAWILGW